VLAALVSLAGLNPSKTYTATMVTGPYTPIGVATWPWWIAKEAGYFEKDGVEVDAAYVGASPIIVQVMRHAQNVCG